SGSAISSRSLFSNTRGPPAWLDMVGLSRWNPTRYPLGVRRLPFREKWKPLFRWTLRQCKSLGSRWRRREPPMPSAGIPARRESTLAQDMGSAIRHDEDAFAVQTAPAPAHLRHPLRGTCREQKQLPRDGVPDGVTRPAVAAPLGGAGARHPCRISGSE